MFASCILESQLSSKCSYLQKGSAPGKRLPASGLRYHAETQVKTPQSVSRAKGSQDTQLNMVFMPVSEMTNAVNSSRFVRVILIRVLASEWAPQFSTLSLPYVNAHLNSGNNWSIKLLRNCESRIDASHSRQPLAQGETLVRYEGNAVMILLRQTAGLWPCIFASVCSHSLLH